MTPAPVPTMAPMPAGVSLSAFRKHILRSLRALHAHSSVQRFAIRYREYNTGRKSCSAEKDLAACVTKIIDRKYSDKLGHDNTMKST